MICILRARILTELAPSVLPKMAEREGLLRTSMYSALQAASYALNSPPANLIEPSLGLEPHPYNPWGFISPWVIWRRGRDSNPRRACTLAGFQDRCIQPLCHLSVKTVQIVVHWCRKEDLNLRPTHYECVALPTELFRQKNYFSAKLAFGYCLTQLQVRPGPWSSRAFAVYGSPN